MTFQEMLNAKIAEQNKILDKALEESRPLTEEEQKNFDNLEKDIESLNKTIAATAVRAEPVNAPIKIPVGDGATDGEIDPGNKKLPAEAKTKKEAPKPFKNLLGQLKAIKSFAVNGSVHPGLTEIQNAATGGNVANPDEGGFAVQTDFAGLMLESAVSEGNILPLVDTYQISGNANKVEWVDIDESSVATTVYGGVQVYWAEEAGEVTATKPKFKKKALELMKLMGIAYATFELDSDSNFVSTLYERAFKTAIRRELENVIVSGNGSGKPKGFLNGGATIAVAKETGQAAATVNWKNISKMYHRHKNPDGANWLMHPDVLQQLDFLSFPVGVGGVPVYLPASSVGSVSSLKGRPIVISDQCAALGTVGDINLVDLSDYIMIIKGGVQQDVSMHVQFLAAENCFRFIFRANGMPKNESALTIKNSSNTRSPYVNLATRA